MPTHIMLCDHGVHGLAYRETDPEQADEESIVDLMLLGECERPVSVIAFDERAGWARDASVDIARKISEKAKRRGIDLPLTARAFVERHPRVSSIIPLEPWVEPIEELRAAMAMIRGAVAAACGEVPSKELSTGEQAEILAKAITSLRRDLDCAGLVVHDLGKRIRSYDRKGLKTREE